MKAFIAILILFSSFSSFAEEDMVSVSAAELNQMVLGICLKSNSFRKPAFTKKKKKNIMKYPLEERFDGPMCQAAASEMCKSIAIVDGRAVTVVCWGHRSVMATSSDIQANLQSGSRSEADRLLLSSLILLMNKCEIMSNAGAFWTAQLQNNCGG